jgi:TonB family protein
MPIPSPDDDPGASPWLLLIPGVLALLLVVVLGFGAFAIFQWINANEKRQREAKANQSKPTVVFPERPKRPRNLNINRPDIETPPDRPLPDTISGGVLNGKAVRIPKPEYPPSARAANARGIVVVQVTIDENGDVISASAISGHQLLRAPAVSAAREAKFNPTKLSNKPVKVTGTLLYNFIE